MTARHVQQAVAGHVRGDRPDDNKRPELVRSRVWFDLKPEQQALLRPVRAAFDEERGQHLDDDAFIEALGRSFLEREAAVDPSGTRPAYQVAITTCDVCERSTQNGSGVELAITAAALERARCDAEVIEGERVTATVSPRKRCEPDECECVPRGTEMWGGLQSEPERGAQARASLRHEGRPELGERAAT